MASTVVARNQVGNSLHDQHAATFNYANFTLLRGIVTIPTLFSCLQCYVLCTWGGLGGSFGAVFTAVSAPLMELLPGFSFTAL